MATILENQDLVMPNGFVNSQAPLVAVFMVTYNHGDYVAQAIESVLCQITTFNVQLFIGEDGSTDATPLVCRQYAEKYPDKIRLFSRAENIGVFKNANLLFKECIASGAKYIALLEGDDFWVSKDKLERQVMFLEEHLDCAGSYHNTEHQYPTGERKLMFKSLPESMLVGNVIGQYAPFHTSSFVFRSAHFCRPNWFKEIHSVDLAMYIWHAQFGYFRGFNEPWSVYRIHQTGLTAGKEHNDFFHQKRLLLYQMLQGKVLIANYNQFNDIIAHHQKLQGYAGESPIKKFYS